MCGGEVAPPFITEFVAIAGDIAPPLAALSVGSAEWLGVVVESTWLDCRSTGIGATFSLTMVTPPDVVVVVVVVVVALPFVRPFTLSDR